MLIQTARREDRVPSHPSWRGLMEESACEVFSRMIGTEVTPVSDLGTPDHGDVIAMVGMAGALCAVFRVRCSNEVALSIAGKMLGGESDPSHIPDAIGEVCNMVAGNFKAKIDGLSGGCMLSTPTVVIGQHERVFSPATTEHLFALVDYEGKPVWLGLEVSG